MKVAVIAPIPHLEQLVPYGDIDFVLPHLCISAPEYTTFYKRMKKENPNRFSIMDNGSWELKKGLSFDRVLDIAKDIPISEVVLPDLPYKKEESYKLTKDAIPTLSKKDHDHFRFMAVPQGNSPMDLVEMYPKYLDLDGVDTIGITRFSCVTNPFDRLVAVRLLNLQGLWSSTMTHHLLGLDNPVELLSQRLYFRSVDTRWPIKYALRHGLFDPCRVQQHKTPFVDKKVRRLNPHSKLKWTDIAKARQNIETLRRFANEV